MDKIYMVTGNSGAYEDNQTWNVAAFTSYSDALAWKVNAQGVANELVKIARTLYNHLTMKEYYAFTSYSNLKDKNIYDPNMSFDAHTGVEYDVDEVLLNPTITK